MAYLILGIVVGFIIAFMDWGEFFDGLLGALTGLFIGILIWMVVGFPLGFAIPTTEVIEEQEIVALTDSTSIEGRKFLFSGYINENLVCRYVINTDKGKHIEEVTSDNVYIKEGDYKPAVIKHKFVPKSDWYWLFCFPIGHETNYTEFLVPENTVTSEYNIDLH